MATFEGMVNYCKGSEINFSRRTVETLYNLCTYGLQTDATLWKKFGKLTSLKLTKFGL